MIINKRKVIMEEVLVTWRLLPESVRSAQEGQRSKSSAYTVLEL